MTKWKTSRRTFLKTATGAAAAATMGAPAVHAQTAVLRTTAWGGKWGEVMKGQVIPAFEKEFKCKVETDSAFPYYPKLQATPKNAPLYEPSGIRDDGPTAAARYWGLSQQDYYKKADVWPLNPEGEIFCILQIEDTRGVENLDDMLKNVPGIGAILIGEGDLSQELGYPRQYEHKVVLEWMKRIVDTCKKHNVVVGHPHVETGNAERIVKEGYRFLMMAPVQSYGHFQAAQKATGRT